VNDAPGFTFIVAVAASPLLSRFITSGLAEVKLTWKLAWAHSLPGCRPPSRRLRVWQDLRSRAETLTSVWRDLVVVPAGIPVRRVGARRRQQGRVVGPPAVVFSARHRAAAIGEAVAFLD